VVQLALTIAVLVMDRRQSGRLRYALVENESMISLIRTFISPPNKHKSSFNDFLSVSKKKMLLSRLIFYALSLTAF
jgi:hypothetical protein